MCVCVCVCVCVWFDYCGRSQVPLEGGRFQVLGEGGGGGDPGHTERGARFPPVAPHPKCSRIFTFIKPAAIPKMRKSLVLNC